MSALEVFRFDGAELRTVMIDGDPWFVARDVAAVLNYADPTSAIRAHCKGVPTHHPLLTTGGAQTVRVISEPDVLRMIVACRLPEAERFERWVFEEVLPTIRHTGSYVAPMSEDEIVQQALAITARRVQQLETRVAELEPVAAHAETFRQADGLRTIGDIANDFKAHCAANFPDVKVKHQDVFDHAGRLAIIIRTASVRHNQPTAQAIEAGWARAHRTTFGTNTRGQQTAVSTRLTPRGEARLWDGLAAWLGAYGTLTIPKN
ncbi:BRO family protein [Microbacterium sp. J1-1]|uniref:BRO family protein n=1 Tax=Microbacterium sp. J1-1 TaxID=2992441 RepID=UPI0021139D07|nr:BRO family protein [Microbacterium sp. J1-1]UUE19353.1 phage antirepressor [Microbacterium sp. J1-1]